MASLVELFQPKSESRASAFSQPVCSSIIGSPIHAFNKAKTEFHAQRFSSALQMLNQILECDTARRRDIIDALLLRGEIRCIQSDHMGGMADFQAALAIDPRNPRISQLLQDDACYDKNHQLPSTPLIHSSSSFENSRDVLEPTKSRLFVPKQSRAVARRTDRPPNRSPILLPYEILSMIAAYLSHNSLKAWLPISRLHRTVARGFLFSTVNLHFRRPHSGASKFTTNARQRCYEMLEYIVSSESFASTITTLRIHGYSPKTLPEGRLLQAMANLSSLRHLRFSECDIEPSLVEAIVKNKSSLHGIYFERCTTIPPGFTAMSSLRSLSLSNIPGSPYNHQTARSILQHTTESLKHLELASIDGCEGWLEPSSLSRITSLSYCDGRLSHTALTTILIHAENLESLTLHVKPAQSFAPASLFKAHRTAFPKLRALSLRINDRFALDLGLFGALVEFVGHRPNLEMLALQDFAGANRMCVAGFGECLGTLPRLKALKVAGTYLKGDALVGLLKELPKSVEAVAVGTSFSSTEPQLVSQLEPVISRLQGLRGLFVHSITKQKSTSAWKPMDQAIGLACRLLEARYIGVKDSNFLVRRGVGGVQLELLEGKKETVIDWVMEWQSKDHDFVLE